MSGSPEGRVFRTFDEWSESIGGVPEEGIELARLGFDARQSEINSLRREREAVADLLAGNHDGLAFDQRTVLSAHLKGWHVTYGCPPACPFSESSR